MSDREVQATRPTGIYAGPDARSNSDWNEVGSENPTEEDQSTDLPEPGSFTIFCPVRLLKGEVISTDGLLLLRDLSVPTSTVSSMQQSKWMPRYFRRSWHKVDESPLLMNS
jgi:hypothetical protein